MKKLQEQGIGYTYDYDGNIIIKQNAVLPNDNVKFKLGEN